MTKELFRKLQLEETVKELPIGPEELRPYIHDKTLIYGYTCERKTFHVYLKDHKIYTVIYEREFSRGKPIPVNMRLLEVTSNRDYIPDKRIYPEMCDYHFCQLLIQKGINLPFTNFQQEAETDERGYYGCILEDVNSGES